MSLSLSSYSICMSVDGQCIDPFIHRSFKTMVLYFVKFNKKLSTRNTSLKVALPLKHYFGFPVVSKEVSVVAQS